MEQLIIIAIVAIIGIIILASSVRIVDEDESKLLFVLGSCKGELESGVNFVPPFSKTKTIETQVKRIEMPTVTEISGDGNRVTINATIYTKVDDPVDFMASVDEYEESIWSIAKSEFTNVITESEAEGIRQNQEAVQNDVGRKLQLAVDDWGIKVERVDITSISIKQNEE